MNKYQINKGYWIRKCVAYIKLYEVREALVDEHLLPMVLEYSWCCCENAHGYGWAQTNIRVDGKRRPLKLHHLVMGSPLPGYCVDHINGDTLDNRRVNLRLCNRQENASNQTTVRGEVPYRGVYRNGSGFRAALTHQGVRHELGTYPTPEEAAEAFDEKALQLRGRFAALNGSRDR